MPRCSGCETKTIKQTRRKKKKKKKTENIEPVKMNSLLIHVVKKEFWQMLFEIPN
jgi:hypothetical protein